MKFSNLMSWKVKYSKGLLLPNLKMNVKGAVCVCVFFIYDISMKGISSCC